MPGRCKFHWKSATGQLILARRRWRTQRPTKKLTPISLQVNCKGNEQLTRNHGKGGKFLRRKGCRVPNCFSALHFQGELTAAHLVPNTPIVGSPFDPSLAMKQGKRLSQLALQLE